MKKIIPTIKESEFFLRKMKVCTRMPDKIYYLHSAIIFTRSIFHIIENNLKNNKAIKDVWEKEKVKLFKRSWHLDLKALRDKQLKEGNLDFSIIFTPEPIWRLAGKKVKMVTEPVINDQVEYIIKDYYSGEVLQEGVKSYLIKNKVSIQDVRKIIQNVIIDYKMVVNKLGLNNEKDPL